MIDYTTRMDAPELVAVCEHCRHRDCIGTCLEYRNAYRRLIGEREIGKQSVSNRKLGRNNDGLEAFGEKHTLIEWAKLYEMNYHTLYKRVVICGWPIEKALTDKKCSGSVPRVFLEADGRKQSVSAWSNETGVSCQTIYARLRRGWNDRDAIYGREA